LSAHLPAAALDARLPLLPRHNAGAVGRNARRRARHREESRLHGVVDDEGERPIERPTKCPRCGSSDLVVGPYMAGVTQGIDIVCGNCNWHGMLQPGIW
jgi:hypothetical protein